MMLKPALSGMLSPEIREQITGVAEVEKYSDRRSLVILPVVW